MYIVALLLRDVRVDNKRVIENVKQKQKESRIPLCRVSTGVYVLMMYVIIISTYLSN